MVTTGGICRGTGKGRDPTSVSRAEAFARAIYAELHHCDEAGAELIVIEDIPNTSEWRAIGDRLKRAATQA